ncbi:hypothetical protein DUNSADRAFT_10317 [Dunaliella salina]|uniref:Uncharacterized protein n=1 Tax=Dunaliella salina TaxID=3046 RepID=A0ABQ7GFK2_DUNSA|nr:hypothetical protein DUNSADRAFT_10317 [Dunaliella salina]|eukprot:KAF5833385.1 hypothetical protein DUNSADRAFT_10317 [Dunaliella salina]
MLYSAISQRRSLRICGLTLGDCSIEDLDKVHEGLRRLTNLSELNIWYMGEMSGGMFPSPGFGAAILSLCVQAALVLNAPTCLIDVHWCPTRLDGYDMDFSTSDDVTKMQEEDRKQEMAALKNAWERMSRAMPVKGSHVKLRTRFQSKEF